MPVTAGRTPGPSRPATRRSKARIPPPEIPRSARASTAAAAASTRSRSTRSPAARRSTPPAGPDRARSREGEARPAEAERERSQIERARRDVVAAVVTDVQTSFASAGFSPAGPAPPAARRRARHARAALRREPRAARGVQRQPGLEPGQHPAGGAEVVQQHPALPDGELAHGEVHGRGRPPRRGSRGRDGEQAVQVRAAVGAQHEVQRGPLEGEPAHHDAAGEQREHVEIEVERGDLQRRAAREAARLGEREAAHTDSHRRPQADRDVGETRFAPQRRRQLRADHRQHAIVRQQHGERGPGKDGQQRHRPQRDGGDADGGARQRTAVRHGRLPGGGTRRTWRAALLRLYNAATPPREHRGDTTRGPMDPPFAMRRAAVALTLLASLAAVPAARGSTEEFSSFDVCGRRRTTRAAGSPARPAAAAWRDEWERSPLAFRTSQGCFTSGQWYIARPAAARTASGAARASRSSSTRVGERPARLRIPRLLVAVPAALGTLGVMFRPSTTSPAGLRPALGAGRRHPGISAAGWLRVRGPVQQPLGLPADPRRRERRALRTAPVRARPQAARAGDAGAPRSWAAGSRRRASTSTPPPPTRRAGADAVGHVGRRRRGGRALGVTWLARAEDRQARSTDQRGE